MADNAIMTEIMTKLANMTDTDCLDKIQHMAFNRKRDLRQRQGAIETASWTVSDEVQMLRTHRSRKPYGATGIILKINKVKMRVDFGSHGVYNVPKSMLMKAE
jgi:hypothetical protein